MKIKVTGKVPVFRGYSPSGVSGGEVEQHPIDLVVEVPDEAFAKMILAANDLVDGQPHGTGWEPDPSE